MGGHWGDYWSVNGSLNLGEFADLMACANRWFTQGCSAASIDDAAPAGSGAVAVSSGPPVGYGARGGVAKRQRPRPGRQGVLCVRSRDRQWPLPALFQRAKLPLPRVNPAVQRSIGGHCGEDEQTGGGMAGRKRAVARSGRSAGHVPGAGPPRRSRRETSMQAQEAGRYSAGMGLSSGRS